MRYLRRIRADQSYFQDCMVFWYTYHENIDGMHESHQGPFQFPISRLIEWLLHDDHLQLGRIEKNRSIWPWRFGKRVVCWDFEAHFEVSVGG